MSLTKAQARIAADWLSDEARVFLLALKINVITGNCRATHELEELGFIKQGVAEMWDFTADGKKVATEVKP